MVQGWYRGRWLQVTCPVDLRARATVTFHRTETARGVGAASPTGACRGGGPKAREAVDRVAGLLGARGWPATLTVSSPLSSGKGMGSSTADVVAAAGAAARALGHEPDSELLADVALAVEPSDGTMVPGIALFDHVGGRVRESLGPAPSLRVLGVDPGGEVDTVQWHGRPRAAGRPPVGRGVDRERWRGAFADVIHGMRTGDVGAVGRGATVSARIHGGRGDAALFPRLERLAGEVGALGIVAAHSGTVLGLLFDGAGGVPGEASRRIRRELPGATLFEALLVDGGVGTGT